MSGMRRGELEWGGRGGVLCALALLCCTALQAAQAPGAPGAEGAKPAAENKPFVFPDQEGRRDPFTFATLAALPVEDAGTGTVGRPTLKPSQIQEKKNEAEAAYNSAEQAFMNLNAADTVSNCDKGLEVFRDINDLSAYKELQEIRERLFRLRKAGERIRLRQTAEGEFAKLNLRLSGVVARDRKSQAIVNSKIVSKGDLVPTIADSADVVVDEILPDQVVFLFRGYRLLLSISDQK